MFLTFKKWVKNIQTAGYNGARTVIMYPRILKLHNRYLNNQGQNRQALKAKNYPQPPNWEVKNTVQLGQWVLLKKQMAPLSPLNP